MAIELPDPDRVEISHMGVVVMYDNAPIPCAVRTRRQGMADDEFWDDVFKSSDPHFAEALELDNCFGISAPSPCPECGSSVACGYDSEGRPMIHVVQEDDEG